MAKAANGDVVQTVTNIETGDVFVVNLPGGIHGGSWTIKNGTLYVTTPDGHSNNMGAIDLSGITAKTDPTSGVKS